MITSDQGTITLMILVIQILAIQMWWKLLFIMIQFFTIQLLQILTYTRLTHWHWCCSQNDDNNENWLKYTHHKLQKTSKSCSNSLRVVTNVILPAYYHKDKMVSWQSYIYYESTCGWEEGLYIKTDITFYNHKPIHSGFDNPHFGIRHYFKGPGRDMNSHVCVSGRRRCQVEPLDYIRIQRDIRMNSQHWPAKLVSLDVHHDLYPHIDCFIDINSRANCFFYMLDPVSSSQLYRDWISK